MMPDLVVLCDIIRHIFLYLFPEFVETILSYYISDPIKPHAYCSRYFCFAVPLTIIFAALLSIATGVGGCWWPISARAILMDVSFWKFSNNIPNSDTVTEVVTFMIILHSTCTGPFSGGIACIGLFDFETSKNINLIFFVPLVLICRMHMNICGESFRFLFILLLRLDASRCNLRSELYDLHFLLFFFKPLPVSLVPLTLWGLLLWHNTGISDNFL